MRKRALFILLSLLTSLLLLIGCGANTSTVGTSTPGTGGPVSLHVDASTYRPSDKIVVLLSNRGTKTITFEDHQTNCTVIQVEHQVNGAWKMIENCGVLSHTSTFALDAGKEMQVTLSAPTNGWPEGLYRVTLTYRLSQTTSPFIMVHSGTFIVKS
jgi:hypothetical protein